MAKTKAVHPSSLDTPSVAPWAAAAGSDDTAEATRRTGPAFRARVCVFVSLHSVVVCMRVKKEEEILRHVLPSAAAAAAAAAAVVATAAAAVFLTATFLQRPPPFSWPPWSSWSYFSS